MYYEEAKKLSNIYQWKDVEGKPEKLYAHFITYNEDILYICEGDRLKGVVSIGDLYRYFGGTKMEFELNTKFTSLDDIDFEKAVPIFEKFCQIHEIPVVKNGVLIGAIKTGEKRSPQVWEKMCKDLDRQIKQWNKSRFIAQKIKKWKSKVHDIEILIYSNIGDIRDYIKDDQKRALSEKRCMINSPDYDKREYGEKYGFRLDFENIRYIHKNGFCVPKDYHSENLNIEDGHRVTPNGNDAPHKVFVFGPCTALGAYVDDFHTIEFFLQDKINRGNYPYEVVNCGTLGLDYLHHGLFSEKMAPGDRVIIFIWGGQAPLIQELKADYRWNLTEIYREMEDPISSWLDTPSHCNGNVNEKIADRIWKDLVPCLNASVDDALTVERSALQEYYISYEIYQYFDEYVKKYSLEKEKNREGSKGAVVVNCNPFTLGHRYLIEKASKQVDTLYVFVVEEDKSFFKFKDRYAMVKAGVSDLKNVIVIPSGKYIISNDTFSQYFDKDVVTNIDSMEYDVRIFGEVVAAKLGITSRFVGEEPTDAVTAEYNKTMKRTLPEYGIEVVEFPRACLSKNSEELISATKVRKLVQNSDLEKLGEYCPESTITYLKDNKVNNVVGI